jgi:hypothetical protein
MAGKAVEEATVEPAAKRDRDDVAALSTWMVENDWEVLGYERHLQEKRAAQPARLQPLEMGTSQLAVFNLHLPGDAWTLLSKVVNRNIVLRRSQCVDSRRRDTTNTEMKCWYALQIAIENTWGNDTRSLRSHFAAVKEEYGAVHGLGEDRFQFISAACCPTGAELKLLAEILKTAAKRQLESVHVLTIDESVIGYTPRKKIKERADTKGDPIPTVFVPRKPHPNGLECFLACTYVTSPVTAKPVPYVCSIVPHLKVGDCTSIGVAQKIIHTWPAALGQPHYFVDAGFGDSKLALETAQAGGAMTASVSATRFGELWRALSCSLPSGCWRAAIHKGVCLVASVHCGIDRDGHRAYQQVISTNWSYTLAVFPQHQLGQQEPEHVEQQQKLMEEIVIPQYTQETLNGYQLV